MCKGHARSHQHYSVPLFISLGHNPEFVSYDMPAVVQPTHSKRSHVYPNFQDPRVLGVLYLLYFTLYYRLYYILYTILYTLLYILYCLVQLGRRSTGVRL
jgi:hypothetical protein